MAASAPGDTSTSDTSWPNLTAGADSGIVDSGALGGFGWRKDAGIWKPVNSRWRKDAGIWKPINTRWRKHSGTWKQAGDAGQTDTPALRDWAHGQTSSGIIGLGLNIEAGDLVIAAITGNDSAQPGVPTLSDGTAMNAVFSTDGGDGDGSGHFAYAIASYALAGLEVSVDDSYDSMAAASFYMPSGNGQATIRKWAHAAASQDTVFAQPAMTHADCLMLYILFNEVESDDAGNPSGTNAITTFSSNGNTTRTRLAQEVRAESETSFDPWTVTGSVDYGLPALIEIVQRTT